MELKFVWALVQSYHLADEHENQIFLFNIRQTDALSDLVGELDESDGSEDSEALVLAALHSLLSEVYFPGKYVTQKTSFDAPPVAFAALHCLDSGGSYSSIYLIPDHGETAVFIPSSCFKKAHVYEGSRYG